MGLFSSIFVALMIVLIPSALLFVSMTYLNRVEKKKKPGQSLDQLLHFNIESVDKRITSHFEMLYELKEEQSWIELMEIIRCARNVLIIQQAQLDPKKPDFAITAAHAGGRIAALSDLISDVERNIEALKQEARTKAKDAVRGAISTVNIRRKRSGNAAGAAI